MGYITVLMRLYDVKKNVSLKNFCTVLTILASTSS